MLIGREEMMGKRILVIEDDPDMQKIYQEMLEGREFEVTYISTGEEGLQIIRDEIVDLVLLDIILEETTGDSFFIHLRLDQKGKNTPVIIVSVLGPVVLKSLMKLGNVTILEKPITQDQLLEEIHAMLAD